MITKADVLFTFFAPEMFGQGELSVSFYFFGPSERSIVRIEII